MRINNTKSLRWKTIIKICKYNYHNKVKTLSRKQTQTLENAFRCFSVHPEIFTELLQITADYKNKSENFTKIKPPEYFNFARDIVDQWAILDEENAANGEEEPIAFWFVDANETKVKWTYKQFCDLTRKAANALEELEAKRTWNRCLLLLPKTPQWWLINIAFIRLGLQLVLATPQSTATDIHYRLQSSGAECVICKENFIQAVETIEESCPNLKTKILISDKSSTSSGWKDYMEVFDKASTEHKCANTKSSDVLQLFFTSGTTSLPKRVVQSHANLGLGFHFLACYVFLLDRNVVFWNLADTGWAKTAWSSLFSPLVMGATIFVHDMPKFDPEETVKTLQKYPIDLMCAPPTVYRMLRTQKLPNMKKRFMTAGEPMNPDFIKFWEQTTGSPIRQLYGQTETPPLIAEFFNKPRRLGSIGKPLSLDVKIFNDDYKPAATGEIGHIVVNVMPERPLGIFLEYEGAPEKNSACVVNGHYLTGDKAYVDEDGYFWFHSRADDVITSAAYRIGPYEVESALQEHPDVLESAVVGSPDLVRGEIVMAYVVLRESGKKKNLEELTKELQEHVKKVTAPYKYPRKIKFVDSLPKTISGKIKRAELRQNEKNESSSKR